MRVTIKDIARETGLSPTTVSIVLNNKPHRLSEETRQRVWEIAKKMNYRPNSMAASLKTKKTKTVGMIISSFTDAYYGELVSGAEEKCLQEGYALITCTEDASNPQYINLLIDRGVDGIILSGSGFYRNKRQELVEYIQSFGIPVVSADSLMQADKVMNVCSDNLLGGYRATAYLLELGHTQIGCITGPIEREGENGSASRRYQGYRMALEEYGIPFQERYVAHGEFNIQSGKECTPKLIKQGVTAIVAANDLCAYGIYKWAKEHHVRIPEDCSIIGYDDIQYSDFFNPSLTTIRQPAHKVGYEAARKIIEYTDEGEGQGQEDIIYQPELIIRESTSAPGKSR